MNDNVGTGVFQGRLDNRSVFNKFSLQFWARRNEIKFLQSVNFFTVPSEKRFRYFNLDQFRGVKMVLPNYPSVCLFQYSNERKIDDSIILLFIGSIAKNRGLESLIDLLPLSINEKEIRLRIVGFQGDPNFFNSLNNQIVEKGVGDLVEFSDSLPYHKMLDIGIDCHIGIGYYLSDSDMDKTIETASNKIYEYAAMGLPVLSNIEINKKWLMKTSTNKGEIISAIKTIMDNFCEYSLAAIEDHKNELNFEKRFSTLARQIISVIDKNNN